jgi:hypothetical protein
LTFDRLASLRRLKPQRRSPQLVHRADADLPFVSRQPVSGRQLLLDTCVYIDELQSKTPAHVEEMIQSRIVNHSAIALAELTHLIGALNPAHPGTPSVLKPLNKMIDAIPQHRVIVPSIRAYGEAGMLAGLVTRLTGQKASIALLNDALLFLQAAEMGCDLLTGNVADFDWFDQLLPGTGVFFYR